MTIIVNPSTGREVTHQSMGAVARWAASDWIVPGNEDINAGNEGLTGAPLNAAAITTSSTSLDVEIDTFEAFIDGSWVGSDDSTHAEHTHTLAGNATTTTLYLGIDDSATDTFIFGPSSEFAGADPKIPIVDVTDDGSGVIDSDDRRPVGLTQRRGILLDSTFDADGSTTLGLDTGTLSDTYSVYEIVIYREDQASSTESYLDLRINGSSSANYSADHYDSFNNTFTSFDDATEWQKIAGVGESSGDSRHGGSCLQVLRVTCPPEVVSNGSHYPTIEAADLGVGKNFDYIVEGAFTSDTASVSRLNLFGGNASTGFVEMYGRGLGWGK